ncbi:dethiobiotin synthase [Robiginitalea aurantiaca]|uniref:ATP-dependent dethiobiotin synthetase BioD n=1 Tax=Robiginitalea aurantiaca TaxID=3056915 RepID=A0ABT7WEI5_9FLAO|nr:dethiobiotin synthase [Robiginitalea aurantiaca]MDM9631318.1 dethiobiotin synthase [Robiginitalea aurantiaca]
MKRIFVTGISTEVGKTIASAILVEALQADYWKPVQAGDLDHSDSHKIKDLISNTKTVIHPNSYALNTPMSPHAAADIDQVAIKLDAIVPPATENHLIIEGAGGLLVPLNENDTILDLIRPEYEVVVVSRHYLGSINHTLLTLQALTDKGFKPFILFSGNRHPSTEAIIRSKSGLPVLGRIEEHPNFDKSVIRLLAEKLLPTLQVYHLV